MSHVEAELKVLYPYYPLPSDCAGAPPSELFRYVLTGNYSAALKEVTSQKVLLGSCCTRPEGMSLKEFLLCNVSLYLDEHLAVSAHYDVLCVGLSCLQIFCQNNFSGPFVGPSFASLFHQCLPPGCSEQRQRLEAMNELVLDTEGVYNLLSFPEYLIVAKIVFCDMRKRIQCATVSWWCFRYCYIHQKIADERSPVIYKEALESLNATENNEALFNVPFFRDVLCLFHMEAASLHLHYYDVGKAKHHLEKAVKVLGIRFGLSGGLGRRTRWQEQDLAQLVLKVEYESHYIKYDDDDIAPALLPSDFPKNVFLADETRLNKIKFKDEDEDVVLSLRPIEQVTLLFSVFLKRKSQAHDALLDEETRAFLEAVLQNPQSWSLQMSALLLRSQTEASDFRAVERSLKQIDEVSHALERNEPSRFERLRLIYSSLFMPKWELQRELARMLVRVGCTKSALEIFEKLQLWDDVVTCYHELDMRSRAAEVIRSLLEKEETPRLLCLLGDATDDVECYHKAWAMSGNKSSRAVRCLGDYHYVRKCYKSAMPFYSTCVQLNHLQFPVWQRLGYCALQVEDWDTCAKAYQKCSLLEPDNFECWNNLSQAYLKLGQQERAWKTLQEALRCNSTSWKLWDNFLLVSTCTGHICQALHAYNRILQLKEKHIDTEILGRIVRVVMERHSQEPNRESSGLLTTATELLAMLSREVPTNPELWYLYGELVVAGGDTSSETLHSAMQYFRKSVAASVQKFGWEKDTEHVYCTLMRALKLTELVNSLSQNNYLSSEVMNSVRMLLRSVITAVKRNQESVTLGELSYKPSVPFRELQDQFDRLFPVAS